MSAAVQPLTDCGTYAGYQRHRKRKETPCEPCKAALATYMDDWRHRTGRTIGRTLTDMEIAHLTGKSGDFL